VTPCHLLMIAADGVVKTVQRKESVAQVTRHYAKGYHSRLTSAVPPHAPSWPSDVSVPFTEEATELLHQEVALDLYRQAKTMGQLDITKEEEASLEEELKKEQCTLKKTADGELERVVAVVAVRLTKEDGCVLVQLGKVDKKGIKVACKLPGSKRAIGELFKTALQRIVDRDLKEFEQAMNFEGVDHHTKQATSLKFGMQTTYIRTVHTAFLNDWLAPQLEVIPASLVPLDDFPVAVPDVFVIKTPSGGGKEEILLYGWMLEDDMELVAEPPYVNVLKGWLEKVYELHVNGVRGDDGDDGQKAEQVGADQGQTGYQLQSPASADCAVAPSPMPSPDGAASQSGEATRKYLTFESEV